ncbi:MAG: hypothetical protein HC853_07865 [Anaerolineae bacterium]|nr:hypothetical protein [Anaerolineae bacterium]
MPHFFISPHLDDIALSCGGFVHRLARAGEAVTVVSVCTADVTADSPLSAAAKHVHGEWQLGEQPYAQRRAEDMAACAALGANAIHLNLLDAVYRRDNAGQSLYERDFIGIPVNPFDWQGHALALNAKLWETLAPHKEDLRVYCPLGGGGDDVLYGDDVGGKSAADVFQFAAGREFELDLNNEERDAINSYSTFGLDVSGSETFGSKIIADLT